MNRQPIDIVSLRMFHCRAARALEGAQYHLAVMHYRTCLESAERREDIQAMRFFALKLSECYAQMGLRDKASQFRLMADGEYGSEQLGGFNS